jgi:tol-pal system protein YbgF
MLPLRTLVVLAGISGIALSLAAEPVLAQSASETSLRLGRVEEQLRQMTGRNEELQHQIRQLQEQMQRQAGDVDFRLKELESGRGGGGGARPAQQPSGAPSQPPQRRSEMAPPQTNSGLGSNSSAGVGGPAPGPQNLGNLGGGPTSGPVSGSPGPLVRQEPGAPMVIAPDLAGGGQNGAPPGGRAPGGAMGMTATATGSPDEELALGQGFLQRKDYEFAETQFNQFLTQFPNDARTADALYGLGESYYQRNRHSDAIEPFLKVVSDYPQSPRAADSMLRLGQTLGAINEKEQACATLLELGRKYPKTPARQQSTREMQKLSC